MIDPDLTLISEPLDLGTQAQVTEADKRIAVRFWAKYGTRVLRALLGAKEQRDAT